MNSANETLSERPLLQIRDLRTWFPIRRGIFSRTVGNVRAVDGVSLDVGQGETVGLVGESGCGKTTLARTVLRLEAAHSGSIVFEGQDLLAIRERDLRRLRQRLQVVFQDPYSSLNPRMTVVDIVTEGLVEHGLIHARRRREAAISLLADVGMDKDALHRHPHEFSGGQRQRISIARAVSLKPRLVICDEPVSALDVSVQAQVLNLLADLREEHGLAYLLISHDLSVVRRMAARTAVMYLGQIVEHGPTELIMARPRHPYTRALIAAVPRIGRPPGQRTAPAGDVPSPANPPPGCRFHPRCPFAVDACRTTVPELESAQGEESTGRVVSCLRRDEI